ncbi:MAG: DNA-binding protein [Planctomycetota bacterium]|nr:MAG: DNA-binding protein [Planctomycetota bacterium]
MKTILSLLLLILIFITSGCVVQIGSCPTSASKAKPDTVAPEAYTISSAFSRIVVVRLKNGTDLLAGLQKAVEKEKIKNAVIISGIGSLTQHHVHVVNNTTFPPGETFMKESIPSDLLDVNGYIVDGRVHAHITISDDKKALGGHLEPDSKAFTFAIITIGVLDDKVCLKRIDDYTWH